MRFLSIETAVCEFGVESAVGLAELCDPASNVESVILLLVCVATVIVVFLLLTDLVCSFLVSYVFIRRFDWQRSLEVCEIHAKTAHQRLSLRIDLCLRRA